MLRSACVILLLSITTITTHVADVTADITPSKTSIPATPDHVISRADLADRLAELERDHASLSTSYEVIEHFGVEATKLADLSEKERAWIAQVQWTSHHDLRRLEVDKHYPGPFEEVRIVETWDGEGNARREVGLPGGRIDGGPPSHVNDTTATLFNVTTGYWTTGGSGPVSALSEGVREGRVLEQRLEGHRLTHVFERIIRGAPIKFELIVDLDPAFRLAGLAWELPAQHPDNNYEGFRARLAFMVDDWMTADGLTLPRRAHRDLFLFTERDLETGPLLAGRRTYERTSASRFEPDAARISPFEMRFEPGGWVYDTRINLAFRVGTNELVLDGAAYRTAEDLWTHPGERLAEVLANATLQVSPVVSSAAWNARMRSLLAGLGAAMAILIVLGALRLAQTWMHASAGVSA